MENNTNIWEEKSYIEPKKNLQNNIELEQNDSTIITKEKSVKKECNDTVKEKLLNEMSDLEY